MRSRPAIKSRSSAITAVKKLPCGAWRRGRGKAFTDGRGHKKTLGEIPPRVLSKHQIKFARAVPPNCTGDGRSIAAGPSTGRKIRHRVFVLSTPWRRPVKWRRWVGHLIFATGAQPMKKDLQILAVVRLSDRTIPRHLLPIAKHAARKVSTSKVTASTPARSV